jgi:small-conductance mechanosensitive channel
MATDKKQSFSLALKRTLTNETLVLAIILLNASLFIALDINPNLTNEIGGWVEWIDFACLVFFIIEALIKISDSKFKGYFKSNWNKLDFFIVIASIPVLLEPFIHNIGLEYGWAGVFRVARVFKLTRVLRSLRILQYTRNNPSQVFIKIKYPIYTILIVAGSNLLITIFDVSAEWTIQYYQYYPSVIIINITWLISRLYSVFHASRIGSSDDLKRKSLEDSETPDHKNNKKIQFSESIESIISTLFQIFIWSTGLVLAFEKAGYDATTILAGIGLGGMAVALAAQDFIGNLIGGILLASKKSFEVGNSIKIGGYEGEVVKLGISDIRIKDISGKITSLPNKMFISEPIENFTEAELASDLICLRIDKSLSSNKLKNATEIIIDQAKSNKYIKDDYSVRFGPMSSEVHELYFEYYLDKHALQENKNKEHESIQELINEQNTAIYISIIQALQSQQISLG